MQAMYAKKSESICQSSGNYAEAIVDNSLSGKTLQRISSIVSSSTPDCNKNCVKVNDSAIQCITDRGHIGKYNWIICNAHNRRVEADSRGALIVFDVAGGVYQVHIHVGHDITSCAIDIKYTQPMGKTGNYLFFASFSELQQDEYDDIRKFLDRNVFEYNERQRRDMEWDEFVRANLPRGEISQPFTEDEVKELKEAMEKQKK